MPSPLTVSRNNYRKNPKKSTIYTPEPLANFIYEVIDEDGIDENTLIVDPCVGKGSLLKPFAEHNFETLGIDPNGGGPLCTEREDYFSFEVKKNDPQQEVIVVCNPPFNTGTDFYQTEAFKKFSRRLGGKGKPLIPMMFLEKIFIDFPRARVAMFAPAGLRNNQRLKSTRYRRLRDSFPLCEATILPLDVFPGVEFPCELLFFNLAYRNSEYQFLPEEVIKNLLKNRQ